MNEIYEIISNDDKLFSKHKSLGKFQFEEITYLISHNKMSYDFKLLLLITLDSQK